MPSLPLAKHLTQRLTHISDLPEGPIERLLLHLDDRSFARMQCVSKAWRLFCGEHASRQRLQAHWGLSSMTDLWHFVSQAEHLTPPADRLERALWAAEQRCHRLGFAEGDNALHVLASYVPTVAKRPRHQRAVQLLLQRRLLPTDMNARGETPLTLACRHSNAAVLGLLAPLDGAVMPKDFLTAIASGLADAVGLLPRLPLPHPTNPRGRGALHLAITGHHFDLVQPLLAAGIDPMARCRGHWNALELATRADHPAAICALVAAGADINAPCPDGFVPLHQAVIGGNLSLVRFCIDSLQAQPETADGRVSSLGLAAEFLHDDLVHYFVTSHSSPIDAPDGDGWTPLAYAARQSPQPLSANLITPLPPTVALLLALGAQPPRASPHHGDLTQLLRAPPQ